MYDSDTSTCKATCQHAQKSPGGGYPVKRATNAQHNADNAVQTQHSAVTVAAVRPIKSAKNCANFQKSTFFTFLAHTRVNGCNFGGGSV